MPTNRLQHLPHLQPRDHKRIILRPWMITLVIALLAASSARADDQTMNYFGTNITPQRYVDYNDNVDEIIASGVKWVRMGWDWNFVSDPDGENDEDDDGYDDDFVAKFDEIVNRLHAAGINILWTLAYTAEWAVTNPPPGKDPTRLPPDNMDDWDDFVSFTVEHFKTKVSCWEIWNEPDNEPYYQGSIADFYLITQTAYNRIKAKQPNPNSTVLLGGLAFNTENYGPGNFFYDLMTNYPAIANYFDVLNYHAYGDSTAFVERYEGMQSIIDHFPQLANKDIWITETGYTTYGDDTLEGVKADMVAQTLLVHSNYSKIKKIFWFTYRNQNYTGVSDREANRGMVDFDRTPLPALYAYSGAGAAEVDTVLGSLYPSQSQVRRSLFYVPADGGDGSHVLNYLVAESTTQDKKYIYYRINDNWLYNNTQTMVLEVKYLDIGTLPIYVDYDSTTDDTQRLTINRANTGSVGTATFTLTDAQFANGQNNRADLRITSNATFHIVSVTVHKQSNPSDVQTLQYLQTTGDETNPIYRESKIAVGTYMYLRLANDWVYGNNEGLDTNVFVDVTYLDSVAGSTNIFRVQYDTAANDTLSIPVARTNTGEWLTATVSLENCEFHNDGNWFSDLRLRADGADLYVRSIKVRRAPRIAAARVKEVPSVKLIELVMKPDTESNEQAYTLADVKGGVECRKVYTQGNTKHQLFFDVCDGLAGENTPNIDISVTFWDERVDQYDKIRLQYRSTAGTTKGITVAKNGDPVWRTVTFNLTDARFDNGLSYTSDFRINSNDDGSPEYVSLVRAWVH